MLYRCRLVLAYAPVVVEADNEEQAKEIVNYKYCNYELEEDKLKFDIARCQRQISVEKLGKQ